MTQMVILSWSGCRLQLVINDENSDFFDQDRKKTRESLLYLLSINMSILVYTSSHDEYTTNEVNFMSHEHNQ